MSMSGQYGRDRGLARAGYARLLTALGCAVLVAACSAEPGRGRALGADLGTFGVEASQSESDCGPGALGAMREVSFDVELARADTELFWDGRVGGHIGTDLAFDVAASARFQLRPAAAADPGCAVTREDSISGVLAADATGAITAFTAEMLFELAAEPDAACTARELAEADLPNLPCSMLYALEGQRTRAPEP
jgi:hypothetical protein